MEGSVATADGRSKQVAIATDKKEVRTMFVNMSPVVPTSNEDKRLTNGPARENHSETIAAPRAAEGPPSLPRDGQRCEAF